MADIRDHQDLQTLDRAGVIIVDAGIALCELAQRDGADCTPLTRAYLAALPGRLADLALDNAHRTDTTGRASGIIK